MRAIIVVALIAFTATAFATRPRLPDTGYSLTNVEFRASTLEVGVKNLPAPTLDEVELYLDGYSDKAVHPTGIYDGYDKGGRAAVAIVYEGSSPELVRALGAAIEQLDLARYLPTDSAVKVFEYSADGVEMRLPWSKPRQLHDAVFVAHDSAAVASPAKAIERAIEELPASSGYRARLLLVVGDGCDPPSDGSRTATQLLDEATRTGIDVFPIIVGTATCTDTIRSSRNIAVARPALLVDAFRTKVFAELINNWFVSFDVTSLGVLGKGRQTLVFSVDGVEPVSLIGSFPAPEVEPRWLSSRLRQVSLAALLVGLIALIVRSIVGRRPRGAVT